MAIRQTQAKNNDRDDRRVFRWGVIMVAVLVVLAVLVLIAIGEVISHYARKAVI